MGRVANHLGNPANRLGFNLACHRGKWPRSDIWVHRGGKQFSQRADRRGNVQLWGITGIQKEAVLSARRAVATVEEIVEELEPQPGALVLPCWVLDFVSVAPGGSHPSYTHGYSERDNDFYVAWDAISRDRDDFRRWMETHVLAG